MSCCLSRKPATSSGSSDCSAMQWLPRILNNLFVKVEVGDAITVWHRDKAVRGSVVWSGEHIERRDKAWSNTIAVCWREAESAVGFGWLDVDRRTSRWLIGWYATSDYETARRSQPLTASLDQIWRASVQVPRNFFSEPGNVLFCSIASGQDPVWAHFDLSPAFDPADLDQRLSVDARACASLGSPSPASVRIYKLSYSARLLAVYMPQPKYVYLPCETANMVVPVRDCKAAIGLGASQPHGVLLLHFASPRSRDDFMRQAPYEQSRKVAAMRAMLSAMPVREIRHMIYRYADLDVGPSTVRRPSVASQPAPRRVHLRVPSGS